MVVFTCNACGESLKKNQVEKHYYTKCRSCNVLSCIDCGKDFWGNEYEQHTKCVSEEEKYSGKNYVPKPNANKNEVKQQQWFLQVQQAIDKAQANPQLRELLVKLKDFPNVPRKEKKFMNFLSSSLKCRNQHICSQAWKILMEGVPKLEQNGQHKEEEGQNNSKDNKNENLKTESANDIVTNGLTDSVEETSTKMSKRERKEERRKKLNKKEKKDKHSADVQDPETTSGEPNRKKRKRTEEEEETLDDSRLVAEDVSVAEEEEETCEPVKKKFKTKFNWADVILQVLQGKGPEMKVKKLRKKVLAEYLSQGCTEKSEEKLWAKFDKRLKKIPGVKVLGDKVKLTATQS